LLVVLRDFVFGGMLTFQHPDLTAFFLPNHCFLGRSLSSGQIPAWNPYAMGGVPFAADPLSGWASLPAMLLYSLFPCVVAVGLFVVFQPMLAGLGVYWFLRGERASRPAATVGGLVLSLGIAASITVVAMHYAGMLAWSAVLLATASRCLQARTWPARLGWIALVAAAWGQLTATFLSAGALVGTGALAAYAIYRLPTEIRAGRLGRAQAAVLVALLLAALPAVNLAYLLPRLAYAPETSLGLGYDGLRDLLRELTGRTGEVVGRTTGPGWPLRLTNSPGAYFGAIPLLLSFGAFWVRRYRLLATSLAAYGAVFYLLGVRTVAEGIEPIIRSWPLADFYLHQPERLRYGMILAVALLAGLGIEAWRLAPSRRARAAMVVPGILVWGFLPLLAGSDPELMVLFAAGAAAGAAALVVARRRPSFLLLVPAVLAVELSVGALTGQARGPTKSPLERHDDLTPLVGLGRPRIDAAAFVRPTPTDRMIRREGPGRLLKLSGLTRGRRGPFRGTRPRPVLSGIEEPIGYNSVQLLRYWSFVRTVNDQIPPYNKGLFFDPPPSVFDLFQVRWVVAARNHPPERDWKPVAGRRQITYEVTDHPPRASVVTSFEVVSSSDEARRIVTSPGFDTSREAVLEHDPGIAPTRGPTEGDKATYEALGTQAARVDVESPTSALLVVRNAYAKNWRARVDGRDAPVLPADYLIQAVPIPAGRHTVVLRYVDPWIGYGLAGSALSLTALLGAAVLARLLPRGTGATPHRTS
jgi:hypothetical protein